MGTRRLSIALWLALAAHPVAAERSEQPLCGTFPGRARVEMAKHRFLSARREASGLPRRLSALRIDRVGDLVVMVDDGAIVSEANRFDLASRSITFSPAEGGAYRYEAGEELVEPGLGESIPIGDDATRRFELSFGFPFFEVERRSLFLNSDGNLTFDRGDRASTARDMARFLGGPPRIALFFTDLDPSASGQVRVANLPDRFVVTWQDVPEWEKTTPNTFQVEITPDGRIRHRFGTVTAASGIVGVSPGGDSGGVHLVDLGGEAGTRAGATAERFQRGRMVDNVALSRRFYGEFPDRFDSLVVWTDFESDLDDAFAFAAVVRNDVLGIGEETFDDSRTWGSEGELSSFVFMGDVTRYPDSPESRVFGAASRPTTLGLLAHEVGHRHLARARVSLPGVSSSELLGRQGSHWSFFLDSDGSFLEGNEIVPEADGRFRTGASVSLYSRLDLYLMGLATAAEVEPFFVVTGASANGSGGTPLDAESTPRNGITITGTRTNVTLDDVQAALGPRVPAFESAPKSFRHAWILLTGAGEPTDETLVSRLERARSAFSSFFQSRTMGRGTITTRLP